MKVNLRGGGKEIILVCVNFYLEMNNGFFCQVFQMSVVLKVFVLNKNIDKFIYEKIDIEDYGCYQVIL